MLADDVTVVIPTHNRIGYLNRALNSVLGRFEHIIIVDDGSKVAVGDAIRVSVGQSCSLFRNERAKGAAAARNLGCQRVVTEWILFLDDDDMIIPDAKNRYEVAIQSAPEVDVWFGGIPCRKCSSLLTPVLRSHLTRRNMPGGCSGVLMRKAVFDSVGGFDVAMYSMQDWDLWIRLFQQAKLSFLGVDVVAYEHGSPGKITHNLSSKYCGLRRLLWKHRDFFSVAERRFHLRRLKVLRLLRNGQLSLLGNLLRLRGWPFSLYYTFRWRKFADQERE